MGPRDTPVAFLLAVLLICLVPTLRDQRNSGIGSGLLPERKWRISRESYECDWCRANREECPRCDQFRKNQHRKLLRICGGAGGKKAKGSKAKSGNTEIHTANGTSVDGVQDATATSSGKPEKVQDEDMKQPRVWPVVNCVLLNPNGTSENCMLDTNPDTIRERYEALLGGKATIIGEGEAHMVLGLSSSAGLEYNIHQPLPYVSIDVHGPILFIRMAHNGTELRDYDLIQHNLAVTRYREGLTAGLGDKEKGLEDEKLDGMGYDEYYSSDADEDTEYTDDYDDEEYDEDDDQLDVDDDGDLYEEDYQAPRRGKSGLVQRKIEDYYQNKYGRYPTELELAQAMERVRIEDDKPKPKALKRGERMEEMEGEVEEEEYSDSYYSSDEDADESYDDDSDEEADGKCKIFLLIFWLFVCWDI
ncbi:hypothetical protein AAMO2058_000718200 [Amorphochlora amoebiformis]